MGIKEDALKTLQELRDAFDAPLKINSAFRCPKHNEEVGGKPSSQHLEGTAFDISTRGMDLETKLSLQEIAEEVGFTGFGYYNTFLHVDKGRARTWGNKWS